MVNECTYFNKLKVENPFIYDTLEDKIKFFHPAFHSMTPEGLNGRLTFLQQCTRQGPNIAKNEPQNMAFGKPPICVLRVGDFYHTKIVIDSVNFSFDPLQWDLNPEGIGVQPMLAKVDLNFKFIGGSSLGGPINELQNAVSFNFFANTSVYNKRKDIVLTKDKKNSDGQKIGTEDELFGYGSFITPEQVNSSTIDTGLEYINLATTDVVVPESERTENGVLISEIDKKTTNTINDIDINDGSIDEAAKESADPTEWVTTDEDKMLLASSTLTIKSEYTDHYDITDFTYDLKAPDSTDDGTGTFSESVTDKDVNNKIATSKKSATFSDYKDQTYLFEGNYSYTFKFALQPLLSGNCLNCKEKIHIKKKINFTYTQE